MKVLILIVVAPYQKIGFLVMLGIVNFPFSVFKFAFKGFHDFRKRTPVLRNGDRKGGCECFPACPVCALQDDSAKRIIGFIFESSDVFTRFIGVGDKQNCRSTIISKGISAGHSQNGYRGLVKVVPEASNCRNFSQCDSLLLGDQCGAHTWPYVECGNDSSILEHESHCEKLRQFEASGTTFTKPR